MKDLKKNKYMPFYTVENEEVKKMINNIFDSKLIIAGNVW